MGTPSRTRRNIFPVRQTTVPEFQAQLRKMAPPSGTIPPTLPPSVEESYRRKCIQLKVRMNEVEESNDGARLRLIRMQRAVEKMRLERAFLLEQLAKRTSTNVEDSEGSPSPPPTPKEKPLRIKRGHRKPSFLATIGDGRAGSAFIQQEPVTLSPSSDAFSHNVHEGNSIPNSSFPNPSFPNPIAQPHPSKRHVPGYAHPPGLSSASTPPKRPRNAFDLYCNDLRSVVMVQHRRSIADGSYDVELKLAQGWRELNDEEHGEFQRRFEKLKQAWDEEKAAGIGGRRLSVFDGESHHSVVGDEDVEMGEDGDEGRSPAAGGVSTINKA